MWINSIWICSCSSKNKLVFILTTFYLGGSGISGRANGVSADGQKIVGYTQISYQTDDDAFPLMIRVLLCWLRPNTLKSFCNGSRSGSVKKELLSLVIVRVRVSSITILVLSAFATTSAPAVDAQTIINRLRMRRKMRCVFIWCATIFFYSGRSGVDPGFCDIRIQTSALIVHQDYQGPDATIAPEPVVLPRKGSHQKAGR